MIAVTLYLTGRSGETFHGAHIDLPVESCLDNLASIAGLVRRGTTLRVRIYDGSRDVGLWYGKAPGSYTAAARARDDAFSRALGARAFAR